MRFSTSPARFLGRAGQRARIEGGFQHFGVRGDALWTHTSVAQRRGDIVNVRWATYKQNEPGPGTHAASSISKTAPISLAFWTRRTIETRPQGSPFVISKGAAGQIGARLDGEATILSWPGSILKLIDGTTTRGPHVAGGGVATSRA